VPSGQVAPRVAYAEWLALGAAGIALSFTINKYFGMSAVALWLLGVSYNVPPVRTKEWPYLDVISESANNAVRLLLGWFALLTTAFRRCRCSYRTGWSAPSSWRPSATPSTGTSRIPRVAASYRKSFRHYTEEYLLLSIVVLRDDRPALFAGIFIVRYHLRADSVRAPGSRACSPTTCSIGMRPNSPVQNPEKLYTDRGFFAYMASASAIFVLLMFTRIPRALQAGSTVEQSQTSPLWILGKGKQARR
jgi:hypothetical protein